MSKKPTNPLEFAEDHVLEHVVWPMVVNIYNTRHQAGSPITSIEDLHDEFRAASNSCVSLRKFTEWLDRGGFRTGSVFALSRARSTQASSDPVVHDDAGISEATGQRSGGVGSGDHGAGRPTGSPNERERSVHQPAGPELDPRELARLAAIDSAGGVGIPADFNMGRSVSTEDVFDNE